MNDEQKQKSKGYRPKKPGFKPREGYKPPYEKREYRPPADKPGIKANLWGLHAVREAWVNPGRTITALYITEQNLKEFQSAIDGAKGLKRPQPVIREKKDIDRLLPAGAVHQGIAVNAQPLEEVFIQDLIISNAGKPKSVFLMLDQVTDPHNVGAILRSASAFGAAGVIMQRRHAPELTGVLVKTASGAAEHIPVCYETNLSASIVTLQDAGYTAIGLDERGEKPLNDIDIPARTLLVLGAEGDGMRPKVREHCNFLARLPTQGAIASLNVSNAAAVALYAALS